LPLINLTHPMDHMDHTGLEGSNEGCQWKRY